MQKTTIKSYKKVVRILSDFHIPAAIIGALEVCESYLTASVSTLGNRREACFTCTGDFSRLLKFLSGCFVRG